MNTKNRKSDRKAEYCRAVRDWLTAHHPAHAELLSSRGIALGWWDTITYCQSRGDTPAECGERIADKPLPIAAM